MKVLVVEDNIKLLKSISDEYLKESILLDKLIVSLNKFTNISLTISGSFCAKYKIIFLGK